MTATRATKRKAADQATKGADKKQQVKDLPWKEKLIQMADKMLKADRGKIGLSAAHRIWNCALDGHQVTETEFATLRHILDTYKFNEEGRQFLSKLAERYKYVMTALMKAYSLKAADDAFLLDLVSHSTK